MAQVNSEPLPPVPQLIAPLTSKVVGQWQLRDLRFESAWLQWWVQLKDKVDVIDQNLVSLSEFNTPGIPIKVPSGFTARTIQGTANRITVSNGDGVGGNPTIDISAAYVAPISQGGTGATNATQARINLGITSNSLSVTNLTISSGNVNLDVQASALYTLLLTSNAVLNLTNIPAAPGGVDICVRIKQDGTGGWTFGLPTNFRKIGSSNSAISSAANSFTHLRILGFDQGTIWNYEMYDIDSTSVLVERLPVAFTQSSVYAAGLTATTTNMRDSVSTTGAATNNSADEWIRCDLGSALSVSEVSVAGGNLSGWGTVSPYLNLRNIQYSTDDINWTTVVTISGVNDTGTLTPFSFSPVTAQYWRINYNGWISTTEFRLFG